MVSLQHHRYSIYFVAHAFITFYYKSTLVKGDKIIDVTYDRVRSKETKICISNLISVHFFGVLKEFNYLFSTCLVYT